MKKKILSDYTVIIGGIDSPIPSHFSALKNTQSIFFILPNWLTNSTNVIDDSGMRLPIEIHVSSS